MKIVHIIDSGGLYGAERVVLDLVAAQLSRGDSAEIIGLGSADRAGPILAAAESRGARATALDIPGGPSIPGAAKLVRYAKTKNADIVHSHGYRPDILLTLADPLSRLPRLSTVHGVTMGKTVSTRHRIARWCRSTMREIVFVSERTQQTACSPFRRGVVIANGVDVEPFLRLRATHPEATHPEATHSGRIDLLAAGRLAAEKDFFLLLDVMAELNRRNIECRLDLCGDGPLRDDLTRYATKLGVRNATFPGFCDDIPDRLHASDMLIFTSLTEGMPVTVLEAMMLGVPVVSTAVGGIPELLDGYAPCRLVQTRSAEDMADAIIELGGNGQRHRASAEGLRNVEARYSSEAMARGYASVYERITERSNL